MSGSKRTKAIGFLIGAVILGIAGAGLLYVKGDGRIKGSDAGSTNVSSLQAYATGGLSKMILPDPAPAPDLPFQNAAGEALQFSDFKGKVTVVNLWATWCAPCKIEMPTLAALAKRYEGSDDVAVAVISMDTDRAQEAAKAFIAEHAPLAYYADPKFRMAFEFPGKGAMPQTIILDREGRVRAVMIGEADWNGPEAVALIEALIKE
ncbi:antioxidant AhpC [Brevundimonas sp. GN22]